jgi:hypothetical protein
MTHPTAGATSSMTSFTPGVGEAWKGPQPELPGPPDTAVCNGTPLPGTCARERSPPASPRQPVASRVGRGRPGRTQPPCGRDRTRCRESPGGSGHPARLWPRLPPACRERNIHRVLPLSPRSSIVALNLVQAKVPSGLAASTDGGGRHRHPEAHGRCPALPWQPTGQGRRRHRCVRHASAAYQQASL